MLRLLSITSWFLLATTVLVSSAVPNEHIWSSRGDSTGLQAYRIADMMERFGVDTFSDPGTFNPWGSAGNYSTAGVIAALNWLLADSGMTMYDREYHFDNSGKNINYLTNMQSWWCPTVAAATGTQFTMAPGSGATAHGTVDGELFLANQSAATTHWMKWVEGLNEPNLNGIPANETIYAQQLIWASAPAGIPVVLPALVVGLPFVEGYMTSYINTTLLAQYGSIANLHIYPSTEADIDDGSNRKGQLGDFAVGFNRTFPGYPQLITEWHPTLYNSHGHVSDPVYDAYYAPMFILSGFVNYNFIGYIWFALFDYGQGAHEQCGLFNNSVANPKNVAYTIQAMYGLTGDRGDTKHTFSAGKINLNITGLQLPINTASQYTGGQYALFQNSSGTFFLYVWNAQANPGGNSSHVTINFLDQPMTSVVEYNISGESPQSVVQSWNSAATISFSLDASVLLFVIDYPGSTSTSSSSRLVPWW